MTSFHKTEHVIVKMREFFSPVSLVAYHHLFRLHFVVHSSPTENNLPIKSVSTQNITVYSFQETAVCTWGYPAHTAKASKTTSMNTTSSLIVLESITTFYIKFWIHRSQNQIVHVYQMIYYINTAGTQANYPMFSSVTLRRRQYSQNLSQIRVNLCVVTVILSPLYFIKICC